MWFGRNHHWNISEPTQGRETNNAAKIQAATAALRKSSVNGIKKLIIFTASEFLIHSYTK